MFLPKRALCNEVSEVDILHLKVFSTGGKGGKKKLDCIFVLDLSSSVTEKHCQFRCVKIVFREINVSVVALCSHSIHLSGCKRLREETGTLLSHFQSTKLFLM